MCAELPSCKVHVELPLELHRGRSIESNHQQFCAPKSIVNAIDRHGKQRKKFGLQPSQVSRGSRSRVPRCLLLSVISKNRISCFLPAIPYEFTNVNLFIYHSS